VSVVAPPSVAADELWFFRFYRQRLANLVTIGELLAPVTPEFPGSFVPDQFILAVAALDSLAGHWARVYGIEKATGGEKMGRFLVEHADANVFGRCSMPDLFKRAAGEASANDLVAALSTLPGSRTQPAMQRRWQDDPTLDAVVTHLAKANVKGDADWVRRSRYGEILYKEFRCSWVHEFDGPGTTQPLFQVAADEPRYDNWSVRSERGGTRRQLVFPLPFLLRTYADVLSSFAARCARDSKTPA
jgi:hypothetical protein